MQNNAGFFGSESKLWRHSRESAASKRAAKWIASSLPFIDNDAAAKANPLFDEIVQVLFVHGLEMHHMCFVWRFENGIQVIT